MYEIAPDAHAWHLYFFPKSVTSYGQNIFHAVKKFTIPPTITPTIHQFTGLGVLYLNFCSFGNFIELSKKAIEYLTRRKIHVFVGFSVRNLKTLTQTSTPRSRFFKRSERDRLPYADAVLISERNDYRTFKYSEKTYEPEEPKRSREDEEEDERKDKLKRSRRSEEDEPKRSSRSVPPSDFEKELDKLLGLRGR
jgi:hypothetical protein